MSEVSRQSAELSPISYHQGLRLRLPAEPLEVSRLTNVLPALAARHLSFEITSSLGEVGLLAWAQPDRLEQAKSLFEACWPQVSANIEDAPEFSPPVVGWRLRTSLPDVLPMLPSDQKRFDLPSALVTLLVRAETVNAVYQVVVEPQLSQKWREQAMHDAARLTVVEPNFFETVISMLTNVHPAREKPPNWLTTYQQDAYEKAASQFLYRVTIRFIANGSPGDQVRSIAMQALRLVTGAFAAGPNGLEPAPLKSGEQLAAEFNARSSTSPAILTSNEVSALWHPPSQLQDVAFIRASSRLFVRGAEIPAPRAVPDVGITIGFDPTRGDRQLALTPATLRQQVAIIGATGTGKSTSALTIFLSAHQQLGGMLLDVKGDLALDAIGRISADRLEDVSFIDAADEHSCLGIDPMGLARGIDLDLSTDILTSCFHREFRDQWGVVIERLMKASVRALLEVEGTTLLDLPRFLRDPRFRKQILSAVNDEMVRDYFSLEFEPMSPGRQLQAVGPVLNRVGAALESSFGRRLFGHTNNVDLVDMKRTGKILIARFPQGLIGERNANIFASLTMTSCLFAAMTLANEAESSRHEWVAVCDEFQNYATSSFTKAYSEGRSFGFCVVACTQFLSAVPADVRSAILANANTLICFRLGEEDAALIGRRFEPYLNRVQLTDLDNYMAAVRTSVDGKRMAPFTMMVKPPAQPWLADTADKIRANSRRSAPESGVPVAIRRNTKPRLVARVGPPPDLEEEDA